MVERIKFSQKAYADIDRIVEFNDVRNRSNNYSQKFISKLNKRLLQLITHPLSGMPADISGQLMLVWDDYYIFYKLSDTWIESLLSIIKKKISSADLISTPPQTPSSQLRDQLAS